MTKYRNISSGEIHATLFSNKQSKKLSNCWESLKTNKPQHRDEIYSSVMVVKAEKIICIRARLNPLLFFNGKSAAKLRIGEGSTTIV